MSLSRNYSCRLELALKGLLVTTILIIASMSAACSKEDSLAADKHRAEDALKISWQLAMYKLQTHRLPQALKEMEGSDEWKAPADPVTLKPYEYKMLDAQRYELCVVFDRASDKGEGGAPGIKYGDPVTHSYGSWVHGAGRQCVQRTLPD